MVERQQSNWLNNNKPARMLMRLASLISGCLFSSMFQNVSDIRRIDVAQNKGHSCKLTLL